MPLLANFDAQDVRTALERARPDLVVLDGHRTIATGGLPVAELSALEATAPAARAELPAAAPGSSVFRMLWTSGSTGFPKAMTWRQDKFVRGTTGARRPAPARRDAAGPTRRAAPR